MLSDNHERRRDEIARQLEWDLYSNDLDQWSGTTSADEILPPGKGLCVACGRNDLIAVSTSDGRRLLLEEVGDGGAWVISNGIARLSEAGDHVEHLQACGDRE